MDKSYRNILVPYDGSMYSQKALKMAIEMAKSFDSFIYLVNVVDVSTVNPPGQILSKGKRKTLEQIKNSIMISTESHLKEIGINYKNSGIVIKSVVLEGDVTRELLKFIQDNDIDLTIIGSKGRSGISKVLTLGSTSRKISELAKCPVIIMH
ncbi:universal stress protein [Candidatus Nitrosotalea okcheonensis]|uniref:Universal stress family protein n=1 Tax=Candidatus Nitrosotalea okcheonensis TaxID=1903276 RepID=A0A2H1FD83_9ARCH|nr:universal stress protein [Candidatus Nitrosotalea okcheonensis]SMH70728.1 Universal stress family protein [Candidatus Nitrosotalea okcheonensis]